MCAFRPPFACALFVFVYLSRAVCLVGRGGDGWGGLGQRKMRLGRMGRAELWRMRQDNAGWDTTVDEGDRRGRGLDGDGGAGQSRRGGTAGRNKDPRDAA